jgi:hypothetical protein
MAENGRLEQTCRRKRDEDVTDEGERGVLRGTKGR